MEAEAKTRALALRDATQQQLESFKARLLSERCGSMLHHLGTLTVIMQGVSAGRAQEKQEAQELRWATLELEAQQRQKVCSSA